VCPNTFCREPLFQKTLEDVRIAVYITLLASLLLYARFVVLVINDITNYLGIACFTVRKKNGNGQWKEAKVVDHQKRS
jgi:ethanolaminephosphotransferase